MGSCWPCANYLHLGNSQFPIQSIQCSALKVLNFAISSSNFWTDPLVSLQVAVTLAAQILPIPHSFRTEQNQNRNAGQGPVLLSDWFFWTARMNWSLLKVLLEQLAPPRVCRYNLMLCLGILNWSVLTQDIRAGSWHADAESGRILSKIVPLVCHWCHVHLHKLHICVCTLCMWSWSPTRGVLTKLTSWLLGPESSWPKFASSPRIRIRTANGTLGLANNTSHWVLVTRFGFLSFHKRAYCVSEAQVSNCSTLFCLSSVLILSEFWSQLIWFCSVLILQNSEQNDSKPWLTDKSRWPIHSLHRACSAPNLNSVLEFFQVLFLTHSPSEK